MYSRSSVAGVADVLEALGIAARLRSVARLFGDTDVTSVWKYNPATRAWDLSYLPVLGRDDFAIAPGDIRWVVDTEYPDGRRLTVARRGAHGSRPRAAPSRPCGKA